jgi:hypothetical protein
VRIEVIENRYRSAGDGASPRAVIARSASDEAIQLCRDKSWIASLRSQ